MRTLVALTLLACAVHAVHAAASQHEALLARVAQDRMHYRNVQRVLGEATSAEEARVVFLGNDVIDARVHPAFLAHPDTGTSDWARAESSTEHAYLVHVRGAASTELRDMLSRDLGTPLGAYVPMNAYELVATPAVAIRAAAHPQVAWVGVREPHHCLSASIASLFQAYQALQPLEQQAMRSLSVQQHADLVRSRSPPAALAMRNGLRVTLIPTSCEHRTG